MVTLPPLLIWMRKLPHPSFLLLHKTQFLSQRPLDLLALPILHSQLPGKSGKWWLGTSGSDLAHWGSAAAPVLQIRMIDRFFLAPFHREGRRP